MLYHQGMGAPEYARGSWVSKKGSRVKHIGVIDRHQMFEPWRPLCNANMPHEVTAWSDDPQHRDAHWYVSANPRAWHGRTVCKNCIRVVEELNQMLMGTDANTERGAPAEGQGEFRIHGFSMRLSEGSEI